MVRVRGVGRRPSGGGCVARPRSPLAPGGADARSPHCLQDRRAIWSLTDRARQRSGDARIGRVGSSIGSFEPFERTFYGGRGGFGIVRRSRTRFARRHDFAPGPARRGGNRRHRRAARIARVTAALCSLRKDPAAQEPVEARLERGLPPSSRTRARRIEPFAFCGAQQDDERRNQCCVAQRRRSSSRQPAVDGGRCRGEEPSDIRCFTTALGAEARPRPMECERLSRRIDPSPTFAAKPRDALTR